MFTQQVGEQEALGFAQFQPQRVAQWRELAPDVPTERGQNVGVRQPADQTVEDAPAVPAEDVGQHRADADAGAVDHLLHLVAHLAAPGDQRPPMAAQRAQVAKRLRGDETGPSQSELTHARQPAAVLDVGLAATQLLDLLGVEQLGLDAGVGQRLPRRIPIDAGRLHRRGLDAVARQPGDQSGKSGRQCTEGARLALRLAARLCTQTHRGGDVPLVHVQPRRARMDNTQRIVHHRVASFFQGVRRRRDSRSDGELAPCRGRCVLPHVHSPRAGYNSGLDADRPSQFGFGDEPPINATTIRPASAVIVAQATTAAAGSRISCPSGRARQAWP